MSRFKLLYKYADVLALIDNIDVEEYARTRNYADGAVSHLSPYISRGLVTLPFVMQRILQRYTIQQAQAFIFELAWREYFQRQWQQLQNNIWKDIKQEQAGVVNLQGIPNAIVQAYTGIHAIDDGITDLYDTMYMHNHLRMYVASIVCNIGRTHWCEPSKWMYYYLADHDIASNTLSWQWVAGTFSVKKYYCNQDNINKYTGSTQKGTYMDKAYEELPDMAIPDELSVIEAQEISTTLPNTPLPLLDSSKPLLLYNSYNLDPTWRQQEEANRVLILEPSHYSAYPVSGKVLAFIIELSQNINGIQVYSGEIDKLIEGYSFPAIYSKQHPAFIHYPGVKDDAEWMFPQVENLKGSFMAYWKQCSKLLR